MKEGFIMHSITVDQIKPRGIPAGEPDHILTLDIRTVRTIQIGYQAETIYLYKAEDDKLTIKEYINGLSGSEYYAKATTNPFKATVRYGRREEVNTDTCIEVFLPDSYDKELQLSSQYGSIITDADWKLERFAAETTDGTILLKTVDAPRIRLASATGIIQIDHAIGFADIHSVTGPVNLIAADGGGRLNTSSSDIFASYGSLNTILECESLNGGIYLTLPGEGGMIVDGISKTGGINCAIDGLEIREKPGNVKVLSGRLGTKPFQNVRLTNINGVISLRA